MTKHEQYYQEMIDANPQVFAEFQDIHDNYALNPQAWQVKFNAVGEKIMPVIREWEKRLCQHSEGGVFGKYSAGLADKFWSLVRKDFPKIDFVGVKIM